MAFLCMFLSIACVVPEPKEIPDCVVNNKKVPLRRIYIDRSKINIKTTGVAKGSERDLPRDNNWKKSGKDLEWNCVRKLHS